MAAKIVIKDDDIRHVVTNNLSLTDSRHFKLKLNKSADRPLALPPEETIVLFKQNVGIPTKKAIWKIFKPKESYKTLCVQMNKPAIYALISLLCA